MSKTTVNLMNPICLTDYFVNEVFLKSRLYFRICIILMIQVKLNRLLLWSETPNKKIDICLSDSSETMIEVSAKPRTATLQAKIKYK